MQIPPQEKRKCEECLNTIPLNHFRLNCSKCRYCQDGLVVPIMLLEKSNDSAPSINPEPTSNLKPETFTPEEESVLESNNHQNF